MEFDDLFAYIGDFGTYQLVLFLTLGLLSFQPGWQNMGMAILDKYFVVFFLLNYFYFMNEFITLNTLYTFKKGSYRIFIFSKSY